MKQCINCGKELRRSEKKYRLYNEYLCYDCAPEAREMLMPVITTADKQKEKKITTEFESRLKESGYSSITKNEIQKAFKNYMRILVGSKKQIFYEADIDFEKACEMVRNAADEKMFLREFAIDQYCVNNVEIATFLYEHLSSYTVSYEALAVTVITFGNKTMIKSYGYAGGDGIINADLGSAETMNSDFWDVMLDDSDVEFHFVESK